MPGPPSVAKADAIAISGWDEDHPAPRLNFQPNPFATIHLAKQHRAPLTERGRRCRRRSVGTAHGGALAGAW